MKKILKDILDWLEPKVSYADLRFVQTEKENIEVENGILSSYNVSTDRGVGIRVLADGAWGFAASNNLDEASLQETAAKALDIARASALTKKEDIRLASEDKHIDTYITPIVKNPFQVSPSEKIDLLVKATKMMLKDKVKKSEGSFSFYKTYKIFVSTEGSELEQTIFESGGGITAYAIGEGDFQKRSYPSSFGGDYATRGYEFIEEMNLLENAERIAEEANQLLIAPPVPEGIMDIVLGGSQLALQVHESCGHPVELDRVLGKEISYAGGSFLTLDKLNNFTYGSPEVTIVADATVPGGLGTFGYDDEGVPASKSYLVNKGKFVGYLMSREDALKLGLKSNGAARAENWNRIPLVRMTNINLLPGNLELDKLIGDIKEGLYLDYNKSWSIDDKRINFQFGTEIAREIKNGKLGKIYKNAVYQGITPEFWKSCDGISSEKYWHVWGVPNCGKGQPGQAMRVAHGTSPARFRKVKVGASK
ncbi:peptidase C69 [Candidatus Atribacteria bacterium RBG_19FT_COMBO_35_14]|uniref:Peptidase C69 n=1 Tax=Candidatus Sediminicultor quintus TaxID=1797291 RepID=A0A1F5AFL7_9BACT|nr:MAG: peptidase C69 [Candidatus Atribacteria bacterium RBG_19FT_COMBO_35_14]